MIYFSLRSFKVFVNRSRVSIATLGDSLTQGNPPPEHRHGNPGKYQSFTYQHLLREGIEADFWNLGIGGQTITQIIDRIQDALHCDIIVIMGGTNDVWRFAGFDEEIKEEIATDIAAFLKKGVEIGHQRAPRTIIIACSIPPFGAVPDLHPETHGTILEANRRIRETCKMTGARYCDVHAAMCDRHDRMHADPTMVTPDGVHFTPEGNKACGEAIGRCILSAVRSKP